ncbi:hypothetical protein [Erythrobacter rubeus]|uniref:Uncharacterized protein n=1 Tax=Erythrobacter rubeus TaxID=2760803 RepID=A0ABR8KLJ7_9SPHN|nr:hypothetical protein [Erythrobacter rubeus]MBD2841281.1 hypothetical protein [Erythrobacter rubeus]
MYRTITIACAATLLSACGSETSGEFTTADGETGEYSIDNSTGETTATIETADGTATLRSGADVPVDLPDGFSLYPGASVVTNTVVNQGEGTRVVLLSFESNDSPEDIADYYKDQAEAAGIAIEVDATINGGRMLAGKAQDGSVFAVNATAEDGKTSGQLTTGLGDLGE